MMVSSNVTTVLRFLRSAGFKCDKKTKNSLFGIRVKAKEQEVLSFLDELDITYERVSTQEYPITCGKDLREHVFLVNYNSYQTLIVTNGDSAVRKSFSPVLLGLGGKTYTNIDEMKDDVITALAKSDQHGDLISGCQHILDSIDGTSAFNITPALKSNKGVITSDFGEIALAYNRLKNAGGSIFFPATGNFLNVDFFHNNIPISAKGDAGGSRYSFCKNPSVLPVINQLGNSNIEMMLKKWYDRDMFGAFNYASYECPELDWWKNKLGSFDKPSLISYVSSNDWRQYNSDVIYCQPNITGKPLGIATDKFKNNYENGCHKPLLLNL
ncbi:MAG: hypothetical protein M0R77_21095, partial [Gammaproteobacteria bacterium]|nr:hypothetical protein [Gammaproteobacteria bacterium]